MKFMLVPMLALGFVMAPRPANPIVVVETSMGTIKIELYEEKAPVTVKNFLEYTDEKFYDGTIIHRVVGRENSGRDFVIQGGGFEPGMKVKKTKPAFVNESTNGLSNEKYTVAMARRPKDDDGGGVGANTATSQFFINLDNNRSLDREFCADKVGYCVFGKVIDGTDVVDKIKAVKTGPKAGHPNVPTDDVVIKSVKRQVENEKK